MVCGLALALALAAAGCGGPCLEGSASQLLSLWPTYWDTRHDVSQIRMCVAGGGCQTRAVPLFHLRLPGTPATGGRPYAQTEALPIDFSALVPARAARLGSSGPPVTLQVTAYAGSAVAVSASATLEPIQYLPVNTCRLHAYDVAAELRSDGTLGYYVLS